MLKAGIAFGRGERGRASCPMFPDHAHRGAAPGASASGSSMWIFGAGSQGGFQPRATLIAGPASCRDRSTVNDLGHRLPAAHRAARQIKGHRGLAVRLPALCRRRADLVAEGALSSSDRKRPPGWPPSPLLNGFIAQPGVDHPDHAKDQQRASNGHALLADRDGAGGCQPGSVRLITMISSRVGPAGRRTAPARADRHSPADARGPKRKAHQLRVADAPGDAGFMPDAANR